MRARKVEESGERAVPEEAVDEAIRLAGGDPRLAIRGLILGQQQIESELCGRISAGYVRWRR